MKLINLPDNGKKNMDPELKEFFLQAYKQAHCKHNLVIDY